MGESIEACWHNFFPEGGRLMRCGRLSQRMLVFLAIEEVFGFVINPSFVAEIEAGRRGSKATDGVNALDESGSVEDTGSAGGDAGEQKLWDGSRINGAASDLRTDDKTAAGAFPWGTGVMDRDHVAIVVEENSLRSDEGPGHSIPAVDLHAD